MDLQCKNHKYSLPGGPSSVKVEDGWSSHTLTHKKCFRQLYLITLI